jgi:amidase
MRIVTSDHRSPRFSASKEPALRVQPGEIVRIETAREPTELLIADSDGWLHVDLDTINVVTGPVYIEGVESGDGVAVEILAIELLDWGANAYFPGFSLVASRLQSPFRRKLPIVDGWVHLTDHLRAPVRPMIGCLGLAPAVGESTTFGKSPWGGNYDLIQMTSGHTAIFPAQTPGGLFYLGDLHAAMGVGEPTYVAIECAGSVTLRFGIRKGMRPATPRIESPERLYILGLTQEEAQEDRWETSRRQACELMFDYLTLERGLSPEEAYLLLSACVDLDYGGPAGVTLASIPLALFD